MAWHGAALQGDPYKTLVVARLSYDVTEKKLQRELEEFGPIKSLRLVRDKKGEMGWAGLGSCAPARSLTQGRGGGGGQASIRPLCVLHRAADESAFGTLLTVLVPLPTVSRYSQKGRTRRPLHLPRSA